MNWEKKGRIFEPKRQYKWLQSHASVPFPLRLQGDMYRIYFGSRDEKNRTQPGYVDIRISDREFDIIDIASEPVLRTGNIGTFDHDGIWESWFIEEEGSIYMYYNGWIQGAGNIPYYSTIGLAISRDGGETFKRYSEGPLMGRDTIDPYILGGPCVLREKGLWRMWYLSGFDFRIEEEGSMYYYNIKYAESDDGVDWKKTDNICIDHKHGSETRIARPCVIKDDDTYRMWYCYANRHDGYRIGYAESDDGIDWKRKDDEVEISPSKEGWDSEMIAYPYVFEHDEEKYMLYNGNGYGETGFGYAVLQED
jgi:hypothetical protein